MTAARSSRSSPKRVLCLGEALVDLICERPIDDLAAADRFVPHFGGAVANVAAVASAGGASVCLAGGAGEDSWGHWLRRRLVREGVDVSLFALTAGLRTLVALVAVDGQAEPRYEVYGNALQTVVQGLGGRAEQAVRDSAAVLVSSNTLAGAEERALTMRVRELALELGRPVIFDANLRLHRWRSRADAAASANACVPGALLVRATAEEAAVMTGEEDPDAAARALIKAGARLVVLTLGRQGAILRGELRDDVPAVPTEAISTVGAGDVLTGVLLAHLAASGFYPPAVAAALPKAVAEAARACRRWGALD